LTSVLAETDGSNVIQNYYLYGNGLISSGGAASSDRIYLLTDGLDNVRFVTDSNGNISRKYDYDPFGNIRALSGSAPNNYQFQTQQLDPESNLYFLRARYYDPNVGRFISKDPVKGILTNPQTQNPYSYSNNNPVNLSDPSGKFWDLIDVGFFALSLKQFADCPSWGNAGWAALDAVSLLPFIPSVGYITHADDAAKLLNKANHIFGKSDHGLDGLLRVYNGDQTKALEAIIKSTQNLANEGKLIQNFHDGVSINVQGFDIVVRGEIIDGVVEIGTAFIQKQP